jgi:hypothetical protein
VCLFLIKRRIAMGMDVLILWKIGRFSGGKMRGCSCSENRRMNQKKDF